MRWIVKPSRATSRPWILHAQGQIAGQICRGELCDLKRIYTTYTCTVYDLLEIYLHCVDLLERYMGTRRHLMALLIEIEIVWEIEKKQEEQERKSGSCFLDCQLLCNWFFLNVQGTQFMVSGVLIWTVINLCTWNVNKLLLLQWCLSHSDMSYKYCIAYSFDSE